MNVKPSPVQMSYCESYLFFYSRFMMSWQET